MNENPTPGRGLAVPGGAVPQRGAFAMSEVLPIISRAAEDMRQRREEWLQLREDRDRKKAEAKRIRANLMVTLRVWGNEQTKGAPMKTAVERNEWADADSNVQQAELDADLAQSLAMSAHASWQEAQAYFSTLQTMLGMERDENRFERGSTQ